MTPRTLNRLCIGCGAAALLCAALASLSAQSDQSKSTTSSSQTEKAGTQEIEAKYRMSVAQARERAQVMHDIYESTLHVMHRHYFRNERSTVPARAMEDVFSELESQSKIDARWISVNTKAMSINHEPESGFEKDAAKAIANGKGHLERIEEGYYHRATAIPLSAGCVGCHNGLLAPPPKSPRFAGLVISIPVNEKSTQEEP